jgi:hypothetical protein
MQDNLLIRGFAMLQRAAVCIIVMLMFPAVLCAGIHRQTVYFNFSFEQDDARAVSSLLRDADAIARNLTEEFGLPLQRYITVIIAPTAEAFNSAQPGAARIPAWAIGVAYPADNRIILLSPRIHLRGPIDLVKTFQHELLHIALGQAFKGREQVPRWLDEGLAMIAADEWSMARLSTITFAVLGGKLLPMESITASFPWEPGQAELAYCESFYFIAFLKGRFGDAAFRKFMAAYIAGRDFKQAIQDAYRVRWEEMEDQWHSYLRVRFSWVPLITSSTTLWFLATLIFILGYLRKKRLNRLKLEEWKKEEEFLYPPDERRLH